jgi:hypothetical protein
MSEWIPLAEALALVAHRSRLPHGVPDVEGAKREIAAAAHCGLLDPPPRLRSRAAGDPDGHLAKAWKLFGTDGYVVHWQKSAASVLRTALVEGGAAATSQGAIEIGTYGFRHQVDPDFGMREAAGEVAGAAIGGAVLGGGFKGLSGLWQLARTGYWSRTVRDAAELVQREASAPRSPFEDGAGAALHERTVAKAADDLGAGRPVELPPEIFLRQDARPGRVYTSDGRSVGVNYEVVDADSLIASHGADFATNPEFPAALQPRDRARLISQTQVGGIARNLAPERLGPSPSAEMGAPIVGPDNVVESGNARVMALRQAYNEGGADGYRGFLRAQGFDVGDMQRPVLVARRVTPLDEGERVAFTAAANQPSVLRMSAGEQGIADARLLDSSVLDAFKGGEVGAAANRPFVRAFLAKLPRAEHGDLVDRQGRLSQAGTRRLGAALMGRAYGDPALLGRALEDSDSNVKAIAGALGYAAGSWARLRDAVSAGQVPSGMDLTRDLLDAVNLVGHARDIGVDVGALARQGEMFGGPSEIAKMLLRGMFRSGFDRPASRKAVAELLNDFVDEALKNTTDARLFGEPLPAGDVMAAAMRRAGREDLMPILAEHTTPDAARTMLTAPDVADATELEAQRIRVANPEATVRVTTRDEAGNEVTVERNLGELLDEADDEIEAAKHIEACALGREAAE